MSSFTRSWKLLSASAAGPVIEFTFGGAHLWTDGPEMVRYIASLLAQERATAIVLNLSRYRYEFGNDLFGLFMVAYDSTSGRIRPMCIVADGQTEASLKSLLAASNMRETFDVTFVSTAEDLSEWLSRKAHG